jgi:hypothetical protein
MSFGMYPMVKEYLGEKIGTNDWYCTVRVQTNSITVSYLWSQLLSLRHPVQLLRVIRLLKSLPLQH